MQEGIRKGSSHYIREYLSKRKRLYKKICFRYGNSYWYLELKHAKLFLYKGEILRRIYTVLEHARMFFLSVWRCGGFSTRRERTLGLDSRRGGGRRYDGPAAAWRQSSERIEILGGFQMEVSWKKFTVKDIVSDLIGDKKSCAEESWLKKKFFCASITMTLSRLAFP